MTVCEWCNDEGMVVVDEFDDMAYWPASNSPDQSQWLSCPACSVSLTDEERFHGPDREGGPDEGPSGPIVLPSREHGCSMTHPVSFPPRTIAKDEVDPCEPGTGWMFCKHADDPLTVCRCGCTCPDQRHCASKPKPGLEGSDPLVPTTVIRPDPLLTAPVRPEDAGTPPLGGPVG